MSEEPIISLRNVSKTYRAYDHPLHRLIARISGGRIGRHKEFHALNDVSFDIHKGETVGIIGRNGSGKSTLLQIICGIRQPTSGSVSVKGRISALLELGSGFQHEFTGRENVFLQGAIIGLTREEMEARFDDIAAFADIGEYIDQPVKTYSSGMFVRLAFAVAVSVEPDILVVDEALAVGDASFRSRCFRRVAELREAGCTILFVSHAMDQIIHVCSRTILLDKGEMLTLGHSKFVVGHYQRLLGANPVAQQAIRKELRMAHAAGEPTKNANPEATMSGDAGAEDAYDPSIFPENQFTYETNGALIEPVRILATAGQRVNRLRSGETYRCAFKVRFIQDAAQVRFAMLIRTPDGTALGGAWSAPSPEEGIPLMPQGSVAEVEFDFRCALNPGSYMLSVSAAGSTANIEYTLHGIKDAEVFSVVSKSQQATIAPVDFSCRAVIRIAELEAD